MGLESGNVIVDFKTNWPEKTDPKYQGDDHLRLIKHILQTQFPGVEGEGLSIPIVSNEQELNWLVGLIGNVQEQFDQVYVDAGDLTSAVATNTAAIGDSASGLTASVNTNTNAIGNDSSGLRKDVNANRADIDIIIEYLEQNPRGVFNRDP